MKSEEQKKNFADTVRVAISMTGGTAIPYRGRANRLDKRVVAVKLQDPIHGNEIDSHTYVAKFTEELKFLEPQLWIANWLGPVSVDIEPSGCRIVYFADQVWPEDCV